MGLLAVVRTRLLRVLLPRRGHRRGAAPHLPRRHHVPVPRTQARAARFDGLLCAEHLRPCRLRERRPQEEQVGCAPRRDGPPEAVQPQDGRRWKRELGAGLPRPLPRDRKDRAREASRDKARLYGRRVADRRRPRPRMEDSHLQDRRHGRRAFLREPRMDDGACAPVRRIRPIEAEGVRRRIRVPRRGQGE